MGIRYILFLLILSLFISCREQTTGKYDSSVVDKEKIDTFFGKDISKVLFDHLYVVVDSLTYERLTKNNTWKNTYATLDNGLPDFMPVSASSTTCYLRGHQHYIEILGPKNTYDEPVGKSGIGFSLENNDTHFHLGMVPKLKTEEATLLNATVNVDMPLGERKHNWFKAFYTPKAETALHTWYAFYNPSFLDSLHGGQHSSYSREAFLAPVYNEQKLFNGIKEISLFCTPKDYNRIVQEMRHLGCNLLKKNGQNLSIASGDITLHIKSSKKFEYSYIAQIYCRLNEEDESVTRLGNLTITNRGKISVWNFDKLHAKQSLKEIINPLNKIK